MGHVTKSRLFQGRLVVRMLGLATTDLLQIWNLYVDPLQRYQRGRKMQTIGWFGGL